jgi:guanine deaminase
MQLFRGHILYSKSREELAVFENSYLAVEDGIIKGVYETLPQALKGLPVQDFGERVIIPAFSDLHVHAPQYPQRALAMDLLLNDWLNSYTFPLEARYADPDFAHAVYDAFVEDLIANGTLHACIFGTIHPEATGYLLEKLEEKGLSAYVGKVNMDKASPEYLCETTEDSLRRTEEFLEKYAHSRTARPILTPRFAPTCSQKLLDGLGILGRKDRLLFIIMSLIII